MIPRLKDYENIVGDSVINDIKDSASPLSEKSVVHVNTVFFGGGVAEMLNTLVLLLSDTGMDGTWRIFKAMPNFFFVSKGFHNAMQGGDIDLTDESKSVYLEYQERNALMHVVNSEDLAIIHDPQPLGLIKYSVRKQPWIWRCHIDLTSPNQQLWNWLIHFINRYDGVVVSHENYKKNDILPEQFIIHPSIDPLSSKNRDLSDSEINKLLKNANIELDKPVVTQISRFDPWKDPMGVIETFKKIKKSVDCKLLLVGGMAEDDPEGPEMFHKVKDAVGNEEDVQLVINASDELVNAIQRVSSVVMQKSLREGFALTVSEALWKGTPVVATRVGGIPLQVIDKKTGFLINNTNEAADACVKLMQDEKLREEMGANAREHVKNNFLITRSVQDHLNLYKKFLK